MIILVKLTTSKHRSILSLWIGHLHEYRGSSFRGRRGQRRHHSHAAEDDEPSRKRSRYEIEYSSSEAEYVLISALTGLKKNLLSISALDAKGMRVAFIDGQVIIWPKGKTIDDTIVIGEQEGGLYKLKEQALIHDIVEPNELWHRRLAHVHYRALPIASKTIPEFQAI